MKNIDIKAGKVNPSVVCNAEKGLIEIKGKSIMANPFTELYNELYDWLEAYQKNCKSVTIINLQLEYFNTSSSKCMLDLFKMLQTMHNEVENANVIINWFYDEEDDDMLEAGEDYKDMLEVPFNVLKADM